MSYSVRIAPAAQRQIRRLAQELQERILDKLEGLRQNPRPRGAEKLSGGEPRYRIRVGDYRVIYRIDDAVLTVLVLKVTDRKEVYRKP